MTCLYCKRETEHHGGFCSKRCKDLHKESSDKLVDIVSPKIISKQLTDHEKQLQEDFINSLKDKEKREKLSITFNKI